MKILVLRFSSIGDIVLTSPVLRCLKTQIPDCELHFATKKQYGFIVDQNPYVDKVHLLQSAAGPLIKSLKQEGFDAVIDLHNNLRTLLIKSQLRVRKTYAFKKLNIQKLLYVKFKRPDLMPSEHVVDRYLRTLEPLGVFPDDQGLDYFIPHKDEVELDWLPEPFQKEYVALVIGAKFATKRLPQDKLIALCDKINKPIVLLGGPEDAERGEEIAQFFERTGDTEHEEKLSVELNKKAIVYNACGKFNLNQSASLVKQASHVFTHDTGLMHIAAAFKKPLFTIWGNTTPHLGMYPYGTRFTVLQNNKISCRPCSKIGFDKCPKGHFKCMRELEFNFYLP